MPYFERRGPFEIIVASFALIFAPLTALLVFPNFFTWTPYFVLFVGVGLGVTHFFITLALYLQSQNLDYFRSTPLNRVIYFAAPVVILVGMALLPALDARTRYPAVAGAVLGAVRLADFYHVGRQSFGMLQIWKRPAGGELPTWHRPAENALFVGLALLQWVVFMSGGALDQAGWIGVLAAVVLVALFGTLAVSYLRAVDRGLDQKALRPLAYMTMQGVCAAAAVYETRLYLVALTLHYVEYHQIMAPRCFYTPLDTSRRSDRILGFLRQRRILFYALLVSLVVVFEARNHVPGDLPPTTLFFVHIFDGIFLLHYFVEAFLWRFGNPFYRSSLRPLYTEPFERTVAAQKQSSVPPRAGFASGLSIAALAAIGLLIAQSQGGVARAQTYLEKTVTGPMQAENHLYWGLALRKRGKVEEARSHLLEARRLYPDGPANAVLRQLDEHEEHTKR